MPAEKLDPGSLRGSHWNLVSSNQRQRELKVTFTEAMTKVREHLESGRSVNESVSFLEIPKLTRVVQRLIGVVDSKASELQTIPGLVKEICCSEEEFLR